jgi:hypothetical protein
MDPSIIIIIIVAAVLLIAVLFFVLIRHATAQMDLRFKSLAADVLQANSRSFLDAARGELEDRQSGGIVPPPPRVLPGRRPRIGIRRRAH